VEWKDYSLQPFLTALSRLKKTKAQEEGGFLFIKAEPAIQAVWNHPEGSQYGIFNVTGRKGFINVHLPDGTYVDELSQTAVSVNYGKLMLPERAGLMLLRAAVVNPCFVNCWIIAYQRVKFLSNFTAFTQQVSHGLLLFFNCHFHHCLVVITQVRIGTLVEQPGSHANLVEHYCAMQRSDSAWRAGVHLCALLQEEFGNCLVTTDHRKV
jgi:hypothetical protein